jgi:ribonuclease PH
VTNTGTIEALTNSTLTIYYSTITNTGGTIQAVGTNAFVDLLPATINNGTLATSGGGTIQTTDSNSTIDTATINNASKLVVNDNTHLTLGSTVNNTGTVSIASAGNGTFLIIDANGATLQGKGTVTLTDRSNNVIEGSAAADVLTNVDNTISGAGQFGNGQLTLVNQSAGIINGSGKLNSLILDTGSGSFGNAGTIEATGAGGLNIVNSTGTNSGTIESLTKSSLTIQNSTINNSKGTVTATGKSAFVALSSATINDGTLATSTSGTIKTTGGNSTIDKATINNASNFVVSDNTDLTLGSTVNNTATFSIASAGNGTFLIVDGNGVAFAAGGTVALTDRSSNIIEGSASADVLTNVDNTIMGAGQLGNG